jgi:hypothetical protein
MGFLARALGRKAGQTLDEVAQDPRVKASIERQHQTIALIELVRTAAGTSLDDQSASTRLAKHLPADADVGQAAIDRLGTDRRGYVDDRAYRLLRAAIDHAEVQPIEPAMRDVFAQEAELGKMTLNDAFEHLASLEPRLRDQLLGTKLTDPSPSRRADHGPLAGPLAESPHVILTTKLASHVVSEYLTATRHGRIGDDDPTPFFERKKLKLR